MRLLLFLGGLIVALTSPSAGLAHRAQGLATGTVAFSSWPLCDSFAVRFASGYAVLRWTGGLWVFADGDEIYGSVEREGSASLFSIGAVTRGRMAVEIEATGVTENEARELVAVRCASGGAS